MLLAATEIKFEILHLKNVISIVVCGNNNIGPDYLSTALGYQILPV